MWNLNKLEYDRIQHVYHMEEFNNPFVSFSKKGIAYLLAIYFLLPDNRVVLRIWGFIFNLSSSMFM
jgi:hypothetical protein